VRQGLDEARVDGQERVEEVREPDAVGLADQPEEVTIGVEVPGGAFGLDLGPGLVGSVEQLVAGLALGVLEGQLDGARAVRLDVDELDGTVVPDALDLCAPRDGPSTPPQLSG